MSTDSPEVIKDVIVYGRIVCVFSIGLFTESIWTKILQANGDMRTPMIAQIVGALVNIALDPLFIFGMFGLPKLGIAGAAIPGLIKHQFPDHASAMMGVYSAMIGVGSAAASGLSVPISNMLGGWRFGLGIWIIPILLGMLVWGAYFLRHPAGVFQSDPAASGHNLLRSGKAWQVTVFYLSRVGAAYFFYTWIPIFLRQRGMSYEDAGFILSVAMFAQLPATLSAHVLEKATGGRGLLIVMAMALAALSCWGILYLPPDWALWMAILFGLATGTVFSRGMALMVERARTPSESIRLSGMSQGIGFTMGALLSLLFTSFLHQGGSFLPFCLVYTFFCVLGMVSGRMSARPGYV